jgi:hypothetical protein
MAPTAGGMAYLTLRGVAVARTLALSRNADRIRTVEVHPGAALLLREAPVDDVRGFKRSKAARLRLLAWLGGRGMNGLDDSLAASDHVVAACAGALAVWGLGSGEIALDHPRRSASASLRFRGVGPGPSRAPARSTRPGASRSRGAPATVDCFTRLSGHGSAGFPTVPFGLDYRVRLCRETRPTPPSTAEFHPCHTPAVFLRWGTRRPQCDRARAASGL